VTSTMNKRAVSSEQTTLIAASLGIDLASVGLEQFQRGLEVEFEHASSNPETDVTHDDETVTAKIARAHW
jgi:Protein of unknown function (DUF5661)